FSFRKNTIRAIVPACPLQRPRLAILARRFFEPSLTLKNLETITFGLQLLQAFEIPQNHQDILWKSLEKTSGFLEILAKSLERQECARAAHSVATPRALDWRVTPPCGYA